MHHPFRARQCKNLVIGTPHRKKPKKRAQPRAMPKTAATSQSIRVCMLAPLLFDYIIPQRKGLMDVLQRKRFSALDNGCITM